MCIPLCDHLEAGIPLRPITLIVATLSLFVLSSGGSSAGPSFSRTGSSTRPLVLPIPAGQTWYVCQGYDGQLTHRDAPALDLSVDPLAAGPRGCMSGSRYSSAGSEVTSPAAGTAYRWPGCCGNDFVCVNFDTGGSAAIGHLSNRIASGTRVGTASRIGTVAWPKAANGDYAHIHVQVHAEQDCTEGSDPVPFDMTHGFRWQCTRNLPYSGVVNQYSGMAVSRCSSSESGNLKKRATRKDDGGQDPVGQGGSRPRLAATTERLIRSAGRATSLAARALVIR